MLNKLKALTQFLTSQNLFDDDSFESWMEDGKVQPRNKNLGADQLLICTLEYDAIFSIQSFSGDPQLLVVMVCTWLIDNDTDRDTDKLEDPVIDVDILDEKTADVEIKITFKESIELVIDPTAPVLFNGKQWAIAPSVDYDVNTVGVGDDAQAPTDATYTRPEEW